MKDTPERIFIVEDEAIVAFEMSDVLEDLGFEVVGPSIHLEEATERASEAQIDAAFLDVNLGQEKSSQPVMEILKERGIPYVFITAYDSEQISFIGPEDKVIKKPVSSKQLLACLRGMYPDMEVKG